MQQKLDGKVKGIVTDHKGEPIACVNVVEKGTRNGTITDMDGSFVLELPEEATLVFLISVIVHGKLSMRGNCH